MAKRFHSGSKARVKRSTQWVVPVNAASGWNGNGLTALAANTVQTLGLLQTGTGQMTTGGDTFLMPQRFTVERIIGEFIVVNGEAAARTQYSWGVILAPEVAGAVSAFDPTLLLNAELSWLHLRHGSLEANVGVQFDCSNQTHLPMGAHFDIRVKRVMRSDERLALQVIANGATFYCLNVRVLVSHVA